MIEIQNINFKNKTIDNVKCSYGNVKDIQMSMIRNTFTVNVNYNEGETITTEYKKPIKNDTIEEVNMNLFDMETEKTQQEQMNVSCKIEEQPEEPKVEELKEQIEEEEAQQEEEPKDKSLSIDELKEILTEKLEKKIPLLVVIELLNKCMIIFKWMTSIHYYKKNKTLSILLKTNIKRT